MTNIELKPAKGAIKDTKRKGRGNSSGKGGESGRGHKGQKSRTGYSRRSGFEGGQMPLYRRLPKKRGIGNFVKEDLFSVVNLGKIDEAFEVGEEVTIQSLFRKGLIKKSKQLKVLGTGDITKSLVVSAHAFSKTALEKLAKASCTINTLPAR